MSPGNIPTWDKEQQENRLCGAKMASKGERMLWADRKFRNAMSNLLTSILTDTLRIASLLVWFWACVVFLARSQWVRWGWVEEMPLWQKAFSWELLQSSLLSSRRRCWRSCDGVCAAHPSCCSVPQCCSHKAPDATAGAGWEVQLSTSVWKPIR